MNRLKNLVEKADPQERDIIHDMLQANQRLHDMYSNSIRELSPFITATKNAA